MIVRKAITERIIISFTGLITDIDRRGPEHPGTAACYGIVSYGALIGGNSGFCQPHKQQQMQTKMHP